MDPDDDVVALREENARLRDENARLREFLAVVGGTCARLAQSADRLRKTS
jgi:hypothetical protein